MKKSFIRLAAVAAVAALTLTSCHNQEAPVEEAVNDTVEVYMTREISPESLIRIYEAVNHQAPADAKVAVKISTGEMGGHNYLKPELIGQFVSKVNGTIVECNTAYAGKRNTTEAHWETIKAHGFLDIAKCDIMDEEGEFEIPVSDTTRIKCDIVGSHMANYDYMVNLAHFKGHQMGGFGGVLKNASIGVASSNGKAYIHTAGATKLASELWAKLPADWDKTPEGNDPFTESMAAAAQAVHNYFAAKKGIVYIDVMNNMSIDCDCSSNPAEPLIKDYGILGSTDPVALDQACLDIISQMSVTDDNNTQPLKERIAQRNGQHIVEYAEKIGLGTRVYKIICID